LIRTGVFSEETLLLRKRELGRPVWVSGPRGEPEMDSCTASVHPDATEGSQKNLMLRQEIVRVEAQHALALQ